jgi:hypothetical protein
MAALQRAWERLAAEVPDSDVRKTLFARLVHSDLLEVVREGGAAAAELKVEALLTRSAVARARG